MKTSIQNYTSEQIETALACANIDTAITLWKQKDWKTYQGTRQALIAIIRVGYGELVGIPQMQFLYFINSHLASRFPIRMPDWKLFTSDLPKGRSIDEPSWAVASSGDFLRATI